MIAITKHVNIVKIKKRCRVGSTTMMAKQRGAGRAIFMHKKVLKQAGRAPAW
jgi:predicted secreted protein